MRSWRIPPKCLSSFIYIFHFHWLPQGKKSNFPPFNMNFLTCKPLTWQLPSDTHNHALTRLVAHLCWNHLASQHEDQDTLDSIWSPEQWWQAVRYVKYHLVCSAGPIVLTLNFAIKVEFGPITVHPLLEYSCKSVYIIIFLHGFTSAECIDLHLPINRILFWIWWNQDILYKNILIHYLPLFGWILCPSAFYTAIMTATLHEIDILKDRYL